MTVRRTTPRRKGCKASSEYELDLKDYFKIQYLLCNGCKIRVGHGGELNSPQGPRKLGGRPCEVSVPKDQTSRQQHHVNHVCGNSSALI